MYIMLKSIQTGFVIVNVLSDPLLDHNHRHAGSDGKLTVPKTPVLETRQRLRATVVVSQSQREEMELQEAKK